jgi:toxin ParE1/3/4
MEKGVRKINYSTLYYSDLQEIYLYGKETFGKKFADIFTEEILHTVSGLSYMFNLYPQCRHIPTKTKIYRNIILGKYLVVYRIKAGKIEVLRIFHGSRSAKIIRSSRSIKM